MLTRPANEVYRMLGNDNLWTVAEQCHQLLSDANTPYAVCGGVAVCVHGYQRNTVDLDVVIRSEDSDQFRTQMENNQFKWNTANAEFVSPDGIAVQCRIAGQKAGKDSEVRILIPLGDDNIEQREGLSVVRLSRLIEMKLACSIGNLRRTHKDFADVVELIDIRNLDGSFSRLLHKSLRPTFRDLVRRAQA